jgi:hypothetical protein
MLWVGGSIMIHGLYELGMPHPYKDIHNIAVSIASGVSENLHGFVEWAVTAFADGVLGLIWGLLLIPLATRVMGPLIGAFSGKKPAAH